MRSASDANPPGAERQRLAITLFCLAVLTVVVVARSRALAMPLERDEGEFAYMGQLMLEGIPPYKLAYNMKLPGTYLAYAGIMALFGQTPAAIHLGVLLVNLGSTVLVFLIGRRLLSFNGALAGGVSFILMSASPGVLGLQAHATHFVTFFALGGIWLWLRAKDGRRELRLFLSGLLFGLAFLCKQPGLFFGFFGAGMILSEEVRSRPVIWKTAALRLGVFCVGLVIPLAATCLWLWWCGTFARFWFWTFPYAQAHAGLLTPHAILAHWNYFFAGMGWGRIWWVTAACGLASLWARPATEGRRFFYVSLLGFSLLAFCGGLYLTRHYFIMALPVLSLLTAEGVVSLEAALGQRRLPPWIAWALFALLCGAFVVTQRAYWFELSPEAAIRALYPGNPFAESPPIAAFIRENTSPEAKIAVFGSEPQIYFYARRQSATGYLYMYDLVDLEKYAHEMQVDMMQQVEKAKPECVVLVYVGTSWLIPPGGEMTVVYWCRDFVKKNYDLIGAVYMYPDHSEYEFGARTVRTDPRTANAIYIYKRKGS